MLRELADTTKYEKVYVTIEGDALPKNLRGEKNLSLAAILVVAVSLKGVMPATENADENIASSGGAEKFNSTRLFAELVGCATADTVEELAEIARGKNSRSLELVRLAIRTVGAIATALEHLEKLPYRRKVDRKQKRGNEAIRVQPSTKKSKLEDLLNNTISWADNSKEKLSGFGPNERLIQYNRDLGCHAGLLLAGVQRYVLKVKKSNADKK
ncbi:hypothetical protein EJ04DRAFT_571620 [Polyplosphaeria fusca]|uniref:Uncharacterized protein n=1 Tax=Polyplosphaeria fusca TaxID=682080 RepID=A0A9P4R9G5_9PLEO|nr:hypothetical protein EJ04DRAFT_571620 [Polyplosphaeria fusca]